MTAPDSAQKGFYDEKRQFQGKDSPKAEAPSVPLIAQPGIPAGQLIAGGIFLAVIALAFYAFALPIPIAAVAPAAPATATAPAK